MVGKRFIQAALMASAAWTGPAMAQDVAAAQPAQQLPEAPSVPTPNAASSTTAPAQAAGAGEVSETTAVSSNAGVGEIVVTAQRREQRLQDVPISVAVTSGESLRKSGTTDLIGLSQRAPGIKLSTDPQSNHIHIRGVGSGLNAGFEQSVGTFVDGIYRPRSRTIQAGLFDVERVEILNGPQTTFFGNNTIAGAVNVTSLKPSEVFGYEAQFLASPSDGEYVVRGGITGGLAEGLSARGAVQFNGMDGYIENSTTGDDGPHLRDMIARGSLRYDTTNFRSDLRVDYARNRDRGTYNSEVTGCPPPPGYPAARGPCAVYLAQVGSAIDNRLDFRSVAGPSSFRLDFVEVGWTNNLDLGAVSLNSISSYSHQKSGTMLNATPLPAIGVGGYYYSPFSQAETYESYSQELRLESQGSGPLQYVFGVYYSHGDLVSRSVSSLYGAPAIGAAGAPVTSAATPIETNRNLFQTDQTRSVFGQLTYRITPALRINGGLRYTSVKKDASRSFLIGTGGPIASLRDFVELDAATQARLVPLAGGSQAGFADPSETYAKLLPAGSIQYDIVPTLTAYASYTKGFKAGGFSDSNGPAQFGSEFVNSYEAGLKGSLINRRIFFTLNGFYSEFDGLQQALTIIGPTGANVTTVGNAASSVSQGVEFSASARAADYLSLNLAASYVDSHFKSYATAGCTALQVATIGATCVQDLSGRPTPFSPKFSGSAGATVTIPVDASNELRIEPNVFYSVPIRRGPPCPGSSGAGLSVCFGARLGADHGAGGYCGSGAAAALG